MIAICYSQSFMSYVGIDIGGTTTKSGLVDETGRIVDQLRVPTIVDNLDGFLASLVSLIRSHQQTSRISGVGIGVPGLRNKRTHRIVVSPNIPCLTDVSLEQLVAEEVQLPIV